MKKTTLFLVALIATVAPSVFAGGTLDFQVPDAGSASLLLGGALGGIMVVRRFFRK